MDTAQAIATLEDLRRNDPVIQRGRNGELTKAWNAFLDSCPDRATFIKHTAGLLITQEMLYDWIEHPIWDRDGQRIVEGTTITTDVVDPNQPTQTGPPPVPKSAAKKKGR